MKKKIRTTRKRLLSVLLAVAMVLTALPLTALPAVAATSGDFEYEVLSETDKTCEITDYTGSATTLSIPQTLDGYSVTGIGRFALANNTTLTSVALPSSVTELVYAAFLGCTALKEVQLPSTLKSIGECAFGDCVALEKLNLPDGIEYIGRGILANTAYAANDANRTNHILYCGNYLLEAAQSLSGDCAVKAGTVLIAERAFEGCSALTGISIPDSVTSIGMWAFEGCTSLANATLGSGITNINSGTFYYCKALTSITIPNNVSSICNWAFSGCTALESITIPDSVTSIGEWAFAGCTALESITIPDSVTSIDEGAFSGCTLLTTIYGYTGSYAETYANENDIPFETLGDVPLAFTYQILDDGTICITGFKGNPHVEDLIIPAVYEGYTVSGVGGSGFYGNNSLRSLTVEDGVKYIYELAFGNCENLEQIVLPDSIEYIQVYFVDMTPSGAFYGTAYCKNPKNWDNGVLYMGNHAYTTEFIDGAEWTVFREGTLSIADMWICSQKVYIPRSVQHIGDRGWFSYYSDEEEEYKSSVVYGFAGSYAETYALNRSYEFIDITPTISKPVDGAAGLIELSYGQMTVGALVDELQYQDSTIQSIAVTDKSGNEVTDLNTICSSDMIFTATYFNGTTALFTVETTQTVLTGDVNGDDKINAVDARWVLQAASGARTFDATQTAAADVNGDGKVNAVDARWILQVASGARTL